MVQTTRLAALVPQRDQVLDEAEADSLWRPLGDLHRLRSAAELRPYLFDQGPRVIEAADTAASDAA